VIPRQVAQMVRAFAAGQAQAALKLHQKYYRLFKDLFLETNPVPVKAALAMLGQVQEEYRLPLVPMSARNRETLRATMRACGILK
jgi:4-hydroxy-tetrahydrodipicolinate synthase